MGDSCSLFFFFFNDTATTEIYTLSLHDALPICGGLWVRTVTAWYSYAGVRYGPGRIAALPSGSRDRKSTRLNSSHGYISYAVFCFKKKKKNKPHLMDAEHADEHRTGRVGDEVVG